ncbi:MAG TPA: hypothetical protein VKW04_22780 [Planctomycetota bacterium]|nr:hypothetical protein [Planctomycetota bacterium]
MTVFSFPLVFLAASLLLAGVVASLPRRRRRRKPRSLPVPPASWPLESVLSLLHLTPFDRLSAEAQRAIVDRLRAADQGPLSMREHGRVNLILGEIALSLGDREEARRRFRSALRWDPRLSLRRLLACLDTPAPLPLASRRAA